MGFNPLKLIGGGLDKLASAIFDGIDSISTTEEEKLALRAEVERAFTDFKADVLDALQTLWKEQASVIRTEIAEGGWLGRSWRPILMLTFGAVIVYAVVAPTFGAPPVDMSGVPDRMWSLMTVGVGGYVAGRTIEKVLPSSKWGKE